MKIAIKNLEGKQIEEIEVSETVFGLKRNDELVHQVMVAISANNRQVIAEPALVPVSLPC